MRVEEKFKRIEEEIEHYKYNDRLVEMLVDYKRLLELENRFKRYTMQDDMHLVTIRQIKEVMKDEWL